ncbi:FKBP-type peptidyl-prolyl cis-trans isomerase [Olleya sp. Bg11-27]|uniref:FKBP-type peptidyl-prolyl cis-trans isomerase n=1 Tax=Olleya sp. Bg11-27 TaxID=2058135 RepID=UPI000C30E136|nr:FKBP-type peptidyl-prolyl cis-trans isomerase [Olleya sp. Bg11-27]AUC75915.1 hypothetical protein CW732_09605 [Olleya sp. Bg11-27]
MKLRKITFALLSIFMLTVACNSDDDDITTFVERDRQEVYDENIAEIEEYLNTHTYNYEDFDFANPYSLANDEFEIVFDTISAANGNLSAISLMDSPQLTSKIVTNGDLDDIDYMLYYLNLRDGLGDTVHPLDAVGVTYEGTLLDGTVFDGAEVVNSPFDLTAAGTGFGVITGFREALIEFKTRDNYSENGDGTISNHNFGIGAAFIPSGIAYFSSSTTLIPSYYPLIFKFGMLTRINTDYDGDSIPSYLEDLDGDGEGDDEDTDDDSFANFVDSDDDNDGVSTTDEINKNVYVIDTTVGETEPVYAANEYETSRNVVSGVITIKTITLVDSDSNGTPDYLESNISINYDN